MSSRADFLPDESMKALRRILGQTQTQFAAFLGVSTPWIKAIESGQRALSEKLARRIMIATGAALGRWMARRGRKGKTRFKPFGDGRVESVWPEGPIPAGDADIRKGGSRARKRKTRPRIGGVMLSPKIRAFSSNDDPARKSTTLPFDKDVFDDHLRLFNAPRSAEQRFHALAPKLKALFIAAAKPARGAVKHRLAALEMSLLDWMAEANREFMLGIDLEE